MTRVLTRAIMLTAVGGLALAPAFACAADAGVGTGTGADPAPPATTVTQLVTPKDPQADQMFTLSARVSPKESDPTPAPAMADDAKKPGGDTKGTGGKGKSGKGKGGKGRGTHPKRHAETGAVIFTVDGKAKTPVDLTRGRASEKLELSSGKHTVTASYSGDENYTASQSAPLTFAVG
jgi:hypothetical protein